MTRLATEPGSRMIGTVSITATTWRFGEFELDERAQELRCRGARIPLQYQPFRLLMLLLASAGHVVTREQLRTDLWPDDVYVDFAHGLNTAVRRLREALGDAADQPQFIETLPRRGYRFIAAVERSSRGDTHPVSVAVLPFLNLAPGVENDYFADGLAEDLITELARVSGLRVVSRTSAMQFKRSERNLRDIGRALRVDVIVEGSVRTAADRVRVATRIVDVRTDHQLWAEDYDGQASDVLAIQKEVAVRVATALAPHMTAAERQRIGSPGTTNVDAYRLYLRGRHCVFQFTEEGIRQGIDYFERACVADPSYALPHAGMAFGYMVLGIGHGAGNLPQKDARARARAAIDRALAIDPRLGQAHAVDACLKFMVDFDWTEAERAFGRSIVLEPGSAETFDTYGLLLSACRRYDEALAAQRRAHDLDPLAPVVMSDIASTLLRAGRCDEAEGQARELLGLHPTFPMAHSTLGWAYVKTDRHEAGIRELEAAVRLSPGNTMFLAQLGQAYAICGEPEKAERVLADLHTLAAERYVSPYHRAYILTGLRRVDAAIDCLEQAVADRCGGVYGIGGSFLFADLRSHPRFVELLRKMNLA